MSEKELDEIVSKDKQDFDKEKFVRDAKKIKETFGSDRDLNGMKNLKKCGCQHNVGHTCNARFCWCEKHWDEGVRAGFIHPNN